MLDAWAAVSQGVLGGLFALWTSFAVASLEIEIEGVHGWASRLPTWRRKSWVCGRRPLTGYHLCLSLTLISTTLTGTALAAIVLQLDGRPLLASALLSLAVFVFVMLMEDSFWFVLNDGYADAVRTGEVAPHFSSLSERLRMYIGYGVVATALWILGYGALDGTWAQGSVAWASFMLTIVVGQVFVGAAIAPLYWIGRAALMGTRRRDERKLAAQSLTLCVKSALVVGVVVGLLFMVRRVQQVG